MLGFKQKKTEGTFEEQVWDESNFLGDDATVRKKARERVQKAKAHNDFPVSISEDEIIGNRINELRVKGIEDTYIETASGKVASYEVKERRNGAEDREKVKFNVEVKEEEIETFENHNRRLYKSLEKDEKVLVLLAAVKDRIIWPENEEVPVIPYEKNRGEWDRIRVDEHDKILKNIEFPASDPPSNEEIRSVLEQDFR